MSHFGNIGHHQNKYLEMISPIPKGDICSIGTWLMTLMTPAQPMETETWAVILVTHVTKVEAIPRVAGHDLESPWLASYCVSGEGFFLHLQMQIFRGYSRFIVVYYINYIQIYNMYIYIYKLYTDMYVYIYTVCLLRYQEPTGILPAVGVSSTVWQLPV